MRIILVLRSGGDFGTDYVDELVPQLARHAPGALITCITDLQPWRSDIDIRTYPELWHGWWAKLAVFLLEGPAVYVDLDTLVVGALKPLLQAVTDAEQQGTPRIWMLESFRWKRGATVKLTERWASGVMAWSGNWSWLTSLWARNEGNRRLWKGDQDFIASALASKCVLPLPIQDCVNVVSYKWHCRQDGIPPYADLVCFHGKPRPREVNWLKEERNEQGKK